MMSREKRRQNKQRYQLDVEPQAQFGLPYIMLMAISGALAAIAFLVNSIPILIGSMVIAPVMPPLILMAIGLANANFKAVAKGTIIALAGLLIALVATVATTWLLSITGVNPAELHLSPMLRERVNPGWYSVVAAFAAGAAGALAVSHKKQDTLVGVVASIALVPTIAAAGIAALVGEWMNVLGGITMLGINVGMIVFVGWVFFNFFSQSGE